MAGDPTFADVIRAIQKIREETPDLAWMLDIPGVGKLLIQRAAGEIDDQEFQYELYKTRFWKQTSDAQRQWRTLVGVDPAQARRQRQTMSARIQQMMGELGVTVPGARRRHREGPNGPMGYTPIGQNAAARIADLALYNGWDENQITNYLLTFATWGEEGQSPAGGIAAAETQIRKLEEQYGVVRQDRNRFRLARDVLAGKQTVEGIEEKLRAQALVRYAGNTQLEDVLTRGGTVGDFFDPYRQMISQELELPPESVSMNDARWNRMLSHNADGTVRPMTMQEGLKYVRSQTEWAQTGNGKRTEAAMARSLLSTFGRTA